MPPPFICDLGLQSITMSEFLPFPQPQGQLFSGNLRVPQLRYGALRGRDKAGGGLRHSHLLATHHIGHFEASEGEGNGVGRSGHR